MIYLASLATSIDNKLEGYILVRTKDELNRIVADTHTMKRIKICHDFAEKFFNPVSLQEYIRSVKQFNKSVIIELEEDVVYSPDAYIHKLREARSAEDIVTLGMAHPKEFKACMDSLLQKDEQNRNELLSAGNKVSRLQNTIEAQSREIEELKEQLLNEQRNSFYVNSKLSSIVRRINFQYNIPMQEDMLFTVNRHAYDKIIYIKEITRVQFVDSLFYYLKEITKALYGMPARALVIESFYATGAEKLYPGFVPHYRVKEQDIISGDVLMLGMQPKIMQDILKNASGISILFVLDRGHMALPHIRGKNVEYYYTASDLKDVPADIPKSRIISYSEDTLAIPYVKDFDSLDSTQKIAKYSSMHICNSLIATLER